MSVDTFEPDEPFDHERLLDLFHQAPGFLCFLRGPQHVFQLANPAYFQVVGHRDILTKPVRVALPEIEGQGFFELLDSVYATGEPFVGRGLKVLLQREPGAPLSEAYVDFVYQPIRGARGSVIGILAQGQDVTELKHQEALRAQAEAALRASEERYRALFQSIDDGYALLQLEFDAQRRPVNYQFLATNAAFEAQTGLVNVVGKQVLEVLPDLDRSWIERYGKVALEGTSIRFESSEPSMLRSFDVFASRSGDPALAQVALVFKDITARKRAEAEREQLLVRESAARAEAEAANRLKDDFLAMVSHELRTPLMAMLGWVQMLRAGGLPADRIARGLETIERNARAQAQLIEDLLDVSGIFAGKLRLELAPVEITGVVTDAVESVRPSADAKQVSVVVSHRDGAMVLGDATRLQQIVWNLLVNAIKFTPIGGRIEVSTRSHGELVELAVADSGVGIAPEFLGHVFERFRQGDAGTTRKHGGLGLGLSIVKHLVEAHGGTITVASEGQGKGTTFTVRLPISTQKRGDAPADAATAFPCPPELEGLSVLVVDDEPDAREVLRAILQRCRMQVTLASSGEEGLQIIAHARPDIVVSDIGMPGLDGYGFIQRLRSLTVGQGGQTPAVALTAFSRTQDRMRALVAGFNNHVPKPVEPMELFAVLSSLARQMRNTSALA